MKSEIKSNVLSVLFVGLQYRVKVIFMTQRQKLFQAHVEKAHQWNLMTLLAKDVS